MSHPDVPPPAHCTFPTLRDTLVYLASNFVDRRENNLTRISPSNAPRFADLLEDELTRARTLQTNYIEGLEATPRVINDSMMRSLINNIIYTLQRMATTLQNADYSDVPAASKEDVIEQLVAVANDPRWTIIEANGHSFTVQMPCFLQEHSDDGEPPTVGLDLGVLEVVFNIYELACTMNVATAVRVWGDPSRSYTNDYDDEDEESEPTYYHHPHVDRDGNLCPGDSFAPLLAARNRNDLFSLVEIVYLTLQNYNDESPYRNWDYFERFNEGYARNPYATTPTPTTYGDCPDTGLPMDSNNSHECFTDGIRRHESVLVRVSHPFIRHALPPLTEVWDRATNFTRIGCDRYPTSITSICDDPDCSEPVVPSLCTSCAAHMSSEQATNWISMVTGRPTTSSPSSTTSSPADSPTSSSPTPLEEPTSTVEVYDDPEEPEAFSTITWTYNPADVSQWITNL